MVSAQPPWSIATSQKTAPCFILADHLTREELRREAPGISTAPMTRSASTTVSSICSVEDMTRLTRPCSDLLEVAHPVD